jgi:hypothetical protein
MPRIFAVLPYETVRDERRTKTAWRFLPFPRNTFAGKPATRRAPSPPLAPLTGPRAKIENGALTVVSPPASVTRSSRVRWPAMAGDAAIVSSLRSGHGRGRV